MPPTVKRRALKREIGFDAACTLVESALSGSTRRDIIDALARARDGRTALAQMRACMRSDAWSLGGHDLNLEKIVNDYDSTTRHDGFHVLRDWDGVADTVNRDTIPVDVLTYVMEQADGPPDRLVLGILLDYYYLYILALLSLKVWDGGQADRNLDRLDAMLEALQGPGGSGQRFASDAATLMLIATSHYELDEPSYDELLDRVRTLGETHRMRVAMGHATGLGCHLRFGFEAAYGRDTIVMRDDNVVDYPWLSFSLATLMDAYGRLRDAGTHGEEREAIVEALLNGLSADARAFVGDQPPASLAGCEAERLRFREQLRDYWPELAGELDAHRPTDTAYSPLALFFNFSHNVLKGAVVDSLLVREPWRLGLNDLFTGLPRGGADDEQKRVLATTLMGYARENPSRIRGRMTPVIVYDAVAGRHAVSVTLRKLAE